MNLPPQAGRDLSKHRSRKTVHAPLERSGNTAFPDSFAAKAKPNEADRETKPGYNDRIAIKTAAIAAIPSVAKTSVSARNDAAGWYTGWFLFGSHCTGILLAQGSGFEPSLGFECCRGSVIFFAHECVCHCSVMRVGSTSAATVPQPQWD